MEINVKDNNSYKYDVIDLSNNQRIPGCQWANDKTGEYEVLVKDRKGGFVIEKGKVKTIIRKGNIKIIKKQHPEYVRRFKIRKIIASICYDLSNFFENLANKIIYR